MADNSFSAQQLQEQSQTLSPRMLQSLNILQMPSFELYEYLTKEIEENPVISFDSIDLAEHGRRARRQKYENSESADIVERMSDDSNSPITSLRLQLSMLGCSKSTERIGYILIGMLDKNGYLVAEDVARLTKTSRVPETSLAAAVKLLQSLEPPGIGAFNLQECILLQLHRKGLKGSDSWIVASEYLDLLGKNQLPQIARKSGIPLHRVINAQQLIRNLNPKPLMSENHTSETEYITPDIRILKAGKGFVVELNQLSADNIVIDNTYSKIYKETDSDSVRSFLTDNMRRAHWLRDSIRQRCETLMDCASQLLKVQRGFFEYGPASLIPYSRKEMAEQLSRSESTISRAFKDKYLECDWGMFPADFLFPKPSIGTEQTITRNSIESLIREIIDSEDSSMPMSDEVIVTTLNDAGIDVSRRTVAKYRDHLGIPASSKRKTFS